MQKLELFPLILSYQTSFNKISDLVPRNISPNCFLEGSEIKLISGPSHAGKTSFLRQVASNLESF
jgi:ABC-type iron transport system FetAB ATPase subunit